MKVLLVGDGAREHMLAEQLARSCELYSAMRFRNPGIEGLAQKYFVCDYDNIEAIGGWAIRERINVALVTSEAALAKGLSDFLADAGISVASPRSEGSAIGENTVYAHNMMAEAGISRPRSVVCRSRAEVLKALAGMPRAVMKPALRVEWEGAKFSDRDFRDAKEMAKWGAKLIRRHKAVVIEEMVDGELFSLQALTDGRTVSVMPPVHTARRALEGGKGELTEGMGSYSTGRLLPFMRQEDLDYARGCMEKLVARMATKGVEYKGPLCGQFIAAKEGTMMLDAYATFGGMEALNNLMQLRTQLVEAVVSMAEGRLMQPSFVDRASVVKFVVPEKYPAKGRRKAEVVIDERSLWDNGAKAYAERVEMKDGSVYSRGERALAICAPGATVEEAEAKAEAAAASIGGKVRHRSDIGNRDYVTRTVKHMAALRSI